MVNFGFHLLYGYDGRSKRIQIIHIIDYRRTNDLVFIHTIMYILYTSQLVNKRLKFL